jgi:phosphinothricin acetyltransferase
MWTRRFPPLAKSDFDWIIRSFAAALVVSNEHESQWNSQTDFATWKKFMSTAVRIRRAELPDLQAITEIYNEAILTTTATFDTEPKSSPERLKWFESHDERHPILVGELDGRVVGWSSLSTWSERHAYDDTAETSFYVKAQYRGQGIGRRLKQETIEEARRLGFHTLIARVTEGNPESLHLNESLGFVRVGTLKEVGRKFGRLLDVHILQKILE